MFVKLFSYFLSVTGIEIPKCNFVMRYDFPKNYQSYVQCKSRARAIDALHVLLIPAEGSKDCVWQLAQYHYIEKVLKQISRQRISSIDIFFLNRLISRRSYY